MAVTTETGRNGEGRRTDMEPVVPTNGSQAKWLMGIVAALLGGVLLGWYNDVRELRPDVAVLKNEVARLGSQVALTNQRLEALTEVLIRREERERRQ